MNAELHELLREESELRQLLRQEVDALTRRNVIAPRNDGCAGCGCNLNEYVVHCRACTQRKRKRELQAARKAASRARQTA